MERMDAELGSLCLVSTTADLELRLDSCAQFTANDRNFTLEELMNKTLSSAAAGKPWVVQGEVFKLIVSLKLDETIAEPHIIMHSFAQRLYDSTVSSRQLVASFQMLMGCRCGVNSAWIPSR